MSIGLRQFRYLFAVDPSLTCSGWALFEFAGAKPKRAGVLKPPGPAETLAARLQFLHDEVASLYARLELGAADVVLCEGPAPLVHNPMSAMKVEQVRGIFETLARACGARVPGRLNPRTVQTEVLGLRGKQLSRPEVKRWAKETAERLFGDTLNSLAVDGARKQRPVPQDVIDALLVGSLAVQKIERALRVGHSPESVFQQKVRQAGSTRRGAARWGERELLQQKKRQNDC